MDKSAETALFLMSMALALLDKAGEAHAAIYLQYAIDILRRVPVPCPE